MALEQSRHFCGGVTLIKIALPDRRGRQVPETWLFLRQVEQCLYGGSSGAVNKLINKVVLAQYDAERPLNHHFCAVGGLLRGEAEIDVVLNSAAIDAVVFALAPLSLVAPVASMTVVFSNMFAGMGWLVRRERISLSCAMANALIITGIVLMTLFGPTCNAVLSVPQVLCCVPWAAFLTCLVARLDRCSRHAG